MKRLIKMISAAILFAAFSIAVGAAGLTDEEYIAMSDYICVYNVDSQSIVYEKNINVQTSPASTVKLMTAIIAYEHYEGKFDTVITVSKEAVEKIEGNSIKLVEGEEITVEELMYALVVNCANDAASVFAYEIAGSEEAFCELMNKKAAEIGAASTIYKNARGIDAEGMTTTAYDTTLITEYAYKLDNFMKYADTAWHTVPATNKKSERNFSNRNFMLLTPNQSHYSDNRAMGMNAGYTKNGGQCVVTIFQDKGLTYIVTVMGGKNDEEDNNSAFFSASALMDKTEGKYGYMLVLNPDEIIREVDVTLAKNVDYVLVTPERKVEYFLPLDTDIKTEISYATRFDNNSMAAPIYEGQRAGEIDVIYKGEVIDTVPLITKNNVTASIFLRIADYLRNLLKSQQVRIAIIIFVLIFIAYLFLSYLAFIKRRNNRYRG